MKNVLVTGSGRSGTSMLAGAFRLTPAYLGAHLHPARPANPKGFFEDAEVNDVNEAILADGLAGLAGDVDPEELKKALPRGQLWLASPPKMLPPTQDRALQGQIATQTANEPFCLKDPRFSSTVNSWLPHAGDCVVLVIFRDPATTVESILKECRTAPYLRDLALSVDDALAIWRQCYCRLLQLYLLRPNILFVHYDRVLDGRAMPMIEELVGCELDRSFPTPELNRTRPLLAPDDLCTAVYQVLRQVDAVDAGVAPTEERRRAVAELLRHPAIGAEAGREGLERIRGAHRLTGLVVRIRERQLREQARELEDANRRVEELRRTKLERDECGAAADASCRKLRAMTVRAGELRRENGRLRQELAFKRANLDRLVGMVDELGRLRGELGQAREAQQRHERSEREFRERCANAQTVIEALKAEKDAISRDLEAARRARRRVRRSLSWRITKPLRFFLRRE